MRRATGRPLTNLRAAALALAATMLVALGFSLMGQGMAQAQDQATPPAATPSPATPPALSTEPLDLDARSMPLGGTLADDALWQSYKARFITDQGRVVDTANGNMSHSEGQGYGMLLALAANDRVAFERIWAWTRANLAVRNDALLAWRWEPDKRPAVGDMNNATDGDMLVAWALAEAAEFWADPSYRVAGRRIAVEFARRAILFKTRFGALILPAVAGFAEDARTDAPVINLSYWVFPAFDRLNIFAPEIDWKGVSQSGLDILKLARFGPARLPSEWTSARRVPLEPAEGFANQFGYNAIRIPLYMAWAGIGEREHYEPFVSLWGKSPPAVIDLAGGTQAEALTEAGYKSVAALVQCAVGRTPFPVELRGVIPSENYYPATLRLMALIAVKMRYPSCLRA